MSAIDNIFLNREIRNRWGLLDRRAMRRKAEAIFKRLTVAIDLDCPVEQLSVAQQQFVEIAKALSLEARVLVLDEPTATLTPGEAEHLFSVMNDLRLLGVGMVFISHHWTRFSPSAIASPYCATAPTSKRWLPATPTWKSWCG